MPTRISSLLDGSTFVSCEKDMANLLNWCLFRIYAKENMNNLPVAYEAARSNGSTLFDVVIRPNEVEEKL